MSLCTRWFCFIAWATSLRKAWGEMLGVGGGSIINRWYFYSCPDGRKLRRPYGIRYTHINNAGFDSCGRYKVRNSRTPWWAFGTSRRKPSASFLSRPPRANSSFLFFFVLGCDYLILAADLCFRLRLSFPSPRFANALGQPSGIRGSFDHKSPRTFWYSKDHAVCFHFVFWCTVKTLIVTIGKRHVRERRINEWFYFRFCAWLFFQKTLFLREKKWDFYISICLKLSKTARNCN